MWILGAGFSKSLGGPLLLDLLAPRLMNDLSATYHVDDYPYLFDKNARLAHWLFNFGTRFRLGPVARGSVGGATEGAHLWQDAEGYLDFLDAAATAGGGPSLRLVGMILEHHSAFGTPGNSDPPPNNRQIAGAARRLMAAECCMFLGNVASKSERFAPYRRWLKRLLHAGDSIITFNYDRVLEVLGTTDEGAVAAAGGARALPPPPQGARECAIASPTDEPNLVIRTLGNIKEEFPRCVNVYKLHGSVSWKRDGDTIMETMDPEFALKCGIDQIAIASRGPTKQSVTEVLTPLWDQAMVALQAARRIVFIGYSFPQADANARSSLIGIIHKLTSRHVDFQIVLGPDKSLPAPVRLEAMLLYSMRTRNRLPMGQAPGNSFMLEMLPLFAEDFFTVADASPMEQS